MPESQAHKQERARAIIAALSKEYPDVRSALDFTTPFELLVATILAAQCTDAQVNKVTKSLFKKYVTPEDYVKVPAEQLEKDIFTTGFYRAKARSLKACCESLIALHGGVVPQTMEELTALKGVGRKTANVVLGNAFGIPGIAVDTHVKRISNLLKLAASDDPDKIEAQLQKVIPRDRWTAWGHLIATHGRTVCVARRPRCADCVINTHCPSRQDS